MQDQLTPRERVEAGALFLDTLREGWISNIDLMELEVETTPAQVLRLATGYSPEWVTEHLDPKGEYVTKYGFVLAPGEDDPLPLAEAWVDVLADRMFDERFLDEDDGEDVRLNQYTLVFGDPSK